MATSKDRTIGIENVLRPGQVRRFDARKYEAMKRAVLKVLPKALPGLTVAELEAAVLAHLPESLFPGGAKAGWWTKAVQLDLEAKGLIAGEVPAAAPAQSVSATDRAARKQKGPERSGPFSFVAR